MPLSAKHSISDSTVSLRCIYVLKHVHINCTVFGSDYLVTMDTFSAAFPVGSVNGNSVCATIDIIDDDKLEGNEMLFIEMTAADSSGTNNILVVGPITTANFTIVDNDCK